MEILHHIVHTELPTLQQGLRPTCQRSVLRVRPRGQELDFFPNYKLARSTVRTGTIQLTVLHLHVVDLGVVYNLFTPEAKKCLSVITQTRIRRNVRVPLPYLQEHRHTDPTSGQPHLLASQNARNRHLP